MSAIESLYRDFESAVLSIEEFEILTDVEDVPAVLAKELETEFKSEDALTCFISPDAVLPGDEVFASVTLVVSHDNWAMTIKDGLNEVEYTFKAGDELPADDTASYVFAESRGSDAQTERERIILHVLLAKVNSFYNDGNSAPPRAEPLTVPPLKPEERSWLTADEAIKEFAEDTNFVNMLLMGNPVK